MTLRFNRSPGNCLCRRTPTTLLLAAISLASPGVGDAARPHMWTDQTARTVEQPPWRLFSSGDRTPNPAVARITAVDGNSHSLGSGTFVAVHRDRGLVVTNWHVIRDARGPIIATFPDGFRSAAAVLKVDKDWDLAAIMIWRPPVAPIEISKTAPQPGELLTIAGYGSGSYRAVTGRCTQYVAPGTNMPYEMVEIAAEARQGDSGGPILNQRGELAGVLFGAGGGTTAGSYCGRVRWFLESAWPTTHAPDEEMVAASNARPTITTWPSDEFVAAPQGATNSERQVTEPTPNDIGASLAPATSSARPPVAATTTTNDESLAGITLFEHTKTVLAVIGVVAILLRMTDHVGACFTRRRNA